MNPVAYAPVSVRYSTAGTRNGECLQYATRRLMRTIQRRNLTEVITWCPRDSIGIITYVSLDKKYKPATLKVCRRNCGSIKH